MQQQLKMSNDMNALMEVLPPYICTSLQQHIHDEYSLIEIVMDLGRKPEARLTEHREIFLSETDVTQEDIDYVTSHISTFMGDNRAGIERTLHRISAIRNRHGKVIGLTCRVGRAVFGTVDIVQDILESGKSLLLLGRPGVGKTTLLREAARILAEKKRVVIVDTSNEIAGDGDVPHSAIGRARRMQVADPSQQHEVMIEAVENHMPEVIVIDEIGRRLEAEAARTIAERGVQLVGTAHGVTLENLLINPTLSDLVGGIDSVTLSDEEARRRGTQKTVLERRAPPTFDVLVEIQDRQTFAVQNDVTKAVDMLLRRRPMKPEIRYRDDSGQIHVEPGGTQLEEKPSPEHKKGFTSSGSNYQSGLKYSNIEPVSEETAPSNPIKPVNIFPYGVGQSHLRQAAKSLHLPIELVDNLREADVLITLKSHYRKRPQAVSEAEHLSKPVYVLRSNTVVQIESCLADIFSLSVQEMDKKSSAIRETEEAIRKILRGIRSVELTPQTSEIRKEQHQLVRKANLLSHSLGREPRRRVRIYQNTASGGK